MNDDKILQMFADFGRWSEAIKKGVDKDIRIDQMYQLAKADTRAAIISSIADGEYRISPPHIARIPKDKGDFREVYVNEPIDRVVLNIANKLLFELCPEMVHKNCKSYQTGIGCAQVVKEVSRMIEESDGNIIGWKSDLSKYFDSVPIRYVDEVFDNVEVKHGKSKLIDVLRDYYHNDIYFDIDGNVQSKYQSMKQGCSVASFLADVVLFHIDERLSGLDGLYIRYSDDMLFVGKDYQLAMDILKEELAKMEMKLNPKKIEFLDKNHWFKFLGFAIKGNMLSMSPTRLKIFQKEIEKRTIKKRDNTLKKAVNSVNSYLYKGNGEFSWATQVLNVVNVKKDIDTMNMFVMDCLRAVQTGKRKVGGLGYVKELKDHCVVRGTGRNVKANRQKTEARIEGYLSLGCMQKAMMTRRGFYNTLAMGL
ncbi:MAG: RNA-directed DNA polymerase [Prevotella sp.]|nr:RNA-directed DNA polymerase [Prevotella sp.]